MRREANEIQKPVNVMLLSYQRCGSSFTGELLSSHPKALYFYEPSMEFLISRNITDTKQSAFKLLDIYNCKNDTIELLTRNKIGKQSIRFYFPQWRHLRYSTFKTYNMTEMCLSSKIRVVKTIRYRMDTVFEILKDSNVNVRVVHLIRDPRAIINSMRNYKHWESYSQFPEKLCTKIKGDLELSSKLPPDRYFRLRYEDLMTNILEISIKLYTFLHIPLHDSLAVFIVSHTKAENFNHDKSNANYFSTYKTSDFDPFHWRKTMSSDDIRQIETACRDVMQELGYEPDKTSETIQT